MAWKEGKKGKNMAKGKKGLERVSEDAWVSRLTYYFFFFSFLFSFFPTNLHYFLFLNLLLLVLFFSFDFFSDIRVHPRDLSGIVGWVAYFG